MHTYVARMLKNEAFYDICRSNLDMNVPPTQILIESSCKCDQNQQLHDQQS